MSVIDLAAQAAEWDEYTRRAQQAGAETVCGPGSTLAFTQALRAWLPTLFTKYGIRSILDAPCGDKNWMSAVDLTGIDYTGWDLNPPPQCERVNLLTKRKIPQVDLIICRDFFAHIDDEQVSKLLTKFCKSGSRYLLATTFPGDNHYDHPYDVNGFSYRPVNLCADPFNLPTPAETLDEPGPEMGRQMALFPLQ